MADFLKEVFADKPLTFDDFAKAVTEKGMNLADLSTGGYVGKEKFTAEVDKYKTQFNTLKKQYDDLAGAVDGDSGLKKQVETLKAEKAEYETKFQQASQELTGYKYKQSALKAGINPDMSDYVVFEVAKMVNETLDFDTALKGFVAKNPQFTADTTKTKVKTSPNFAGDGAGEKTDANSKMNKALLQAVGRG